MKEPTDRLYASTEEQIDTVLVYAVQNGQIDQSESASEHIS